ncbi:MAG: tetratricopeptide repeat protein [Bacteroidia bacterium]
MLFTFNSFAQNRQIDSLLQLVKTDKDDTIKVIHLDKLSRVYLLSNDYVKSLTYSTKELALAYELNYNHGIALAHNKIGVVYSSIGNYPEALKNYYLALKYCEQNESEIFKANILDNIAIVFMWQDDYTKALSSYYSSLKLYKAQNDTLSFASTYTNIAIIYSAIDKLPNALHSLDSGLYFAMATNNTDDIASIYAVMASVYRNLTNYTKSKEYCNLALYNFELQQNKSGIANCYTNLAQICVRQGNTKQARLYFNKALIINLATNSKEAIAHIYLNLAELDTAKHDYLAAFKHYKLHVAYKDSLHNDATIEKTTQLTMQYEFDKLQQKQIYAQQLQHKTLVTKWTTIVMIIVVLAVLIIGTLIYFRLIQQQTTQTKIHTEKERISADLHDNIGSQLSHLINAMEYEQVIQPNKQLEKLTTNAHDVLQELRQTIWVLNVKNVSVIELDLKLKNYLYQLSAQYTHIQFNSSATIVSQRLLNNSLAIALYRITQEGINNAIKHSKAATIRYTCVETASQLCITITDDGVGFDTSIHKEGHYGVNNLRTRAKEHNILLTITSETNNGTTVQMTYNFKPDDNHSNS